MNNFITHQNGGVGIYTSEYPFYPMSITENAKIIKTL